MVARWVIPGSALIDNGDPVEVYGGYTLDDLAEFLTKSAGLPVRGVSVSVAPSCSSYYFDLVNIKDFKKIDGAIKAAGVALRVPVQRITNTHGRGMFGLTINHPAGAGGVVPFRALYLDGDPGQFRAFLGLGDNLHPVFLDLAECPHILIAGASGSGKSCALASVICSLLVRNAPGALSFIFIDPKLVEFAPYEKIPHNRAGHIISTAEEARGVLLGVCDYMGRKYEELRALGYKSINDQPPGQQSRLVVVVDEFADLILADPTLEEVVVRVAQKGRAAGVHLLLATQRPTVRVISGLIKANITTRLALRVASVVDSVNILDHKGAEQLGRPGDAIIKLGDRVDEVRAQVPFITSEEVQRVADYWTAQAQDPEGFDPTKYYIKK